MIKKILLALAILLVVIQFIRPTKNLSADAGKDVSTAYPLPADVKAIFERACYDCHSNSTVYPWYAEIQPVGWWLSNHVNDGKRHFNLNNFASMKVALQKKKMEDCLEQIKDDDMPLSSYTLIHRNAKLSAGDKELINNWCHSIIDTLQAKYPPDSLILKREKWHD